MSSPPSDPEEQAPDGACSDLLDLIFQIQDAGDHNSCEDMIDDLALFIERKGLSEEAQAWLHGRIAGTIPGRTPYA